MLQHNRIDIFQFNSITPKRFKKRYFSLFYILKSRWPYGVLQIQYAQSSHSIATFFFFFFFFGIGTALSLFSQASQLCSYKKPRRKNWRGVHHQRCSNTYFLIRNILFILLSFLKKRTKPYVLFVSDWGNSKPLSQFPPVNRGDAQVFSNSRG